MLFRSGLRPAVGIVAGFEVAEEQVGAEVAAVARQGERLAGRINQLPAPEHLADFRKVGDIPPGVAVQHH